MQVWERTWSQWHSRASFSSKSSYLHSIKLYATTSVSKKKALALNRVRSSPIIATLCSGTVCSVFFFHEFSTVWISHLIVSNSYRRDGVKHFYTALELAPLKHPKFIPSVTPINLEGSCWLCSHRQSSTFAQTELNCLVSISNMNSKNRGQVFLRRCERLTGFSGIVDDAVTVGYLHFFHHKEYRKIFITFTGASWNSDRLVPAVPAIPAGKKGLQQITPSFATAYPGSFRDVLANPQEQLARTYSEGITQGVEDHYGSIHSLVEQIRSLRLLCGVSSAIQVRSFLVIPKKWRCSANKTWWWEQRSPGSIPHRSLPASPCRMSCKVFHLASSECLLSVSQTTGLPQWWR